MTEIALKGRGTSTLVATTFGACWALWAASLLPMPYAVAVCVGTLILAGGLWLAGFGLLRAARNDPAPDAEEIANRTRTRRRFIWVVIAEVVAMNVAANILIVHHHLAYIGPTIALIVGLHFYLLIWVFDRPIYATTATLMSAAAVIALVGLATGHILLNQTHGWDIAVGLACALVLWGTCAARYLATRAILRGA